MDRVLGDDAALAKDLYNVGSKGLWEKGNNILLLSSKVEEYATIHNLGKELLEEKVKNWKSLLLKERSYQIRPALDNKVLLAWNAMMIEALADAYAAVGNESWLNNACGEAEYIYQHAMDKSGRLIRTVNKSEDPVYGFLDDYAFLAKAWIRLGEVSADEKWFLHAKTLLEYVLENFSSKEGSLFLYKSTEEEQLAAPHYEFQDNVIPASNSVMALNLFYLGNIFENQQWIEKSRTMLATIAPIMEKGGSWTANWGKLALHFNREFFTLVVCGPNAKELALQIATQYIPDTLICILHKPESQLPVLQNRWSEQETLIYPCTLHSCLPPVETIGELMESIGFKDSAS